MSVLFATSLGSFVVDLDPLSSPELRTNFLQLCACGFYDGTSFFNVQRGFVAQGGDRTETGLLGACFAAVAAGRVPTAPPPLTPFPLAGGRRHSEPFTFGLVAVRLRGSAVGAVGFGSQFYVSLGPGQHALDRRGYPIGRVAEAFSVIQHLSNVETDRRCRPLAMVRVLHAIVLDDGGCVDLSSAEALKPLPPPPPCPAEVRDRPESDEAQRLSLAGVDSPSSVLMQRENAAREAARLRAVVLEMVGDLPSVDATPVDNVLFVAKLNPETTSDGLRVVFSQFGAIQSCEVVSDPATHRSLGYAFVEFASTAACERAFRVMDGAVIDDRRVSVDFSQSVSREFLVGGRRVVRRGRGAAAARYDPSQR
eukprot:gnl/Ergobibamus_cyprinoides/338.p1 GENE.gnl/Ergobibamus_cyprinoides/338~~gnl/Ergobibamus_cyprinoides/338.p1  ORF type:complete len:366 (-),score=70.12 gnl/Ergobibamus_cyprinoides/338:1300-2397(-)